jgi:pimeloyl-ACP methyl ester carboxylesterase
MKRGRYMTPKKTLTSLSKVFKPEGVKTAIKFGSYWKKGLLPDLFHGAGDYRRYRKAKPALRKEAPRGDSHPVLILPGFLSNDISTVPLRRMLKAKGYKTYRWEGGVNLGLKEKTVRHLAARLKEIYEENGNQKVSLIGHSLGGMYARVLAQEFPNMVRGVITVQTPFGLGAFKEGADPILVSTIEKLGDPRFSLNNAGMCERLLTPPPTPTTSIFSKTDDIAAWQACLNPATGCSENIEVAASHSGTIWHKDTIAIILERLAEPKDNWKPSTRASNEKPPANPQWKPNATPDWRMFPPL